jgi:hypothetical protein
VGLDQLGPEGRVAGEAELPVLVVETGAGSTDVPNELPHK